MLNRKERSVSHQIRHIRLEEEYSGYFLGKRTIHCMWKYKYYQFSEYIRYIEFTLYNKDISIIKLYDNYLKILLKLKKIAENMINFINENKEDWKKKGIVVDDDSFLRDMYMSDEPYIFSKKEIQKSIYGDIFQRKLGI